MYPNRELSKKSVIGGTLLIWLIKFGIRPMHISAEPLSFFLGIAPNFFGSFLIPFGACWFFGGRTHYVARIFRLNNQLDLARVCLLGFAMLVVNEYLQMIPVFGRTFDPWDILFSAAGLSISFFVFGSLLRNAVDQPLTAVVANDNPLTLDAAE